MINFSVLLSVYIKEQPIFLEQSLASILNQTLIPPEIVLIKDGSLTTELDLIIKKYQNEVPMIKVIQLPQNQGLGKALNEGLKHCSHELVARMDTDDIAKSNRFERQIQVFEEHPEVDSVYMNFCQALTGNGGWPLSVFLTPDKKPFFAGTYFPKYSKNKHIGFMDLLELIHNSRFDANYEFGVQVVERDSVKELK